MIFLGFVVIATAIVTYYISNDENGNDEIDF